MAAIGHPCPFEWNIEFPAPVKITGKNIEDFANRFNDAVRKQTKDKIPKAIIYEEKPDSATKIPGDSPFAKEMDMLIQRYSEVTSPLIKKGVHEYGGGTMEIEFPANFPVACLLLTAGSGAITYDETKEGLKITIHRELECRAYHVSSGFLEIVKEYETEKRIPEGKDPVSYVFATHSGMMWALHNLPDPAKEYVEEPILSGVTLYLPGRKVVLAIETKDKHEEITKSMRESHYLESTNEEKSGGQPPSPGKE